MKKNILFSTTRQWNPGDELILMGVINVLKEIFGEFNPIIYNRNPEIRQRFNHLNILKANPRIVYKGKGLVESFFRCTFYDNSFKDDTDIDFVDLIVFAGSPEWFGGRLRNLYEKIRMHKKPTIYLGIGTGENFDFNKFPKLYKHVLNDALLITARDQTTKMNLRELNPFYMPCPALLSAESRDEREIRKIKKVGLIFGTYKAVGGNNISRESYDYLIRLYGEIIKEFEGEFDAEIICHYIDELPEAKRVFKGREVHYSYESGHYIDIYKRFDLIIGPRVHGIGVAASMGIPGILIVHDLRGQTGEGFLADLVRIGDKKGEVIDLINNLRTNIKTKNKKLIEHKRRTKNEFIKLIKSKLHEEDLI